MRNDRLLDVSNTRCDCKFSLPIPWPFHGVAWTTLVQSHYQFLAVQKWQFLNPAHSCVVFTSNLCDCISKTNWSTTQSLLGCVCGDCVTMARYGRVSNDSNSKPMDKFLFENISPCPQHASYTKFLDVAISPNWSYPNPLIKTHFFEHVQESSATLQRNHILIKFRFRMASQHNKGGSGSALLDLSFDNCVVQTNNNHPEYQPSTLMPVVVNPNLGELHAQQASNQQQSSTDKSAAFANGDLIAWWHIGIEIGIWIGCVTFVKLLYIKLFFTFMMVNNTRIV